MGKALTERGFAKLSGCSHTAVAKGIATGRVKEGPRGIDPGDRRNAYFVEKCRYKAIGKMETHGRVSPGWAALCLPVPGRAPKPVFYYAPSGETILASGTFFDSWRFDSETWEAIDPAGKIHTLELVTNPDAPPPWMKEPGKLGRPPLRPRAVLGVVRGHGKPRADRATARRA